MGTSGLEVLPQVGADQDCGYDGANDLARLRPNQKPLSGQKLRTFSYVFLTVTLQQVSPEIGYAWKRSGERNSLIFGDRNICSLGVGAVEIQEGRTAGK